MTHSSITCTIIAISSGKVIAKIHFLSHKIYELDQLLFAAILRSLRISPSPFLPGVTFNPPSAG